MTSGTDILPSVRALLGDLVDYAGLFPPAALALDPAIRNFVRYRNEPDAWMLGRFVCPAAKLGQLSPYRDELFGQSPPTRFSVLGRGGETVEAFRAGFQQDLADIRAFCETHGGNVSVDAFETRLPAALTREPCTGELVTLLAEIRDGFSKAGTAPAAREAVTAPSEPDVAHGAVVAISVEVALGAADRRNIENAVAGISFFNFKRAAERPGGDAERIAFKLRCGGTEAGAFPSVETLAFAIAHAIVDVGVPMKFTAGLHHPIRLFHDSVQTKMHGFLNVFCSAALGRAHLLAEDAVAKIIADERHGAFKFDADGFSWQEMRAGVADILETRRDFATSFGSCSFDEPRDDLRKIGVL